MSKILVAKKRNKDCVKKTLRDIYVAEILEKALLLMDLLEHFFSDPFLKEKIVLKGGAALNLFYLELPRLSVDVDVDVDLNYIGEIGR